MILRSKRPLLILATSAVLLTGTGCQNAQPLLQAATQMASAAPTSGESQSAVKQLLTTAVTQALNNFGSGAAQGDNSAFKLMLPPQLQQAANAARQLGFGANIDAIEQNMNKAAAKAMPAAKDVFTNSIKNMSIADASALIQGGDNSVTNFFRNTAGKELHNKFLPIVSESTSQVGMLQQANKFSRMLKTVALLAGVNKPEIPDLNEYITNQATEAVFKQVAKEEKNVRANPAEAATGLLRKVFSYYGQK